MINSKIQALAPLMQASLMQPAPPPALLQNAPPGTGTDGRGGDTTGQSIMKLVKMFFSGGGGGGASMGGGAA